MESEKYDAISMDFKNLISCIQYHDDCEDSDVILATFKTINDICSNESCGRDAFREAGGLDFLVEFLFLTDNTIFLEQILKTLAFVIDENVHSQMYLSKKSVFEILQTIWKKKSFPTTVQKNALVLLSTILYHNSAAQNLLFEIGLLQDLLNTYEQHAQFLMINSPCLTSNLDTSAVTLWMSINSVLCFAVNNPQNEKNQDICKNIFLLSLRIWEFSSNAAVISSVSSFLTLTVSDNAKCQDYFSSCDGLLVLKRCFQKYFDTLLIDMKVCNGMVGKETYQAINNIVGVISSASVDHEKNAAVCGKLGILSIMMKLLFIEIFDCQLKTKLILSLGHCIAACCTNKSYVLETENFDAFLKKCLELKDRELSSACKYLLQVCLENKGSPDNNLHPTSNSRFDTVISSKCDSKYFSDTQMENFALEEMLNPIIGKIPSLKQNSTKLPSINSSGLKRKINSRPLEKAYSSSSSSFKNASRTAHRRKKSSKISERFRNKLLSLKQGHFNSSAVQCDLLSDRHFSPKNEKYSDSIHSNTNLASSKCKSYNKELNNRFSFTRDKFRNQDRIYNEMPFTDFLVKETKCSTPKSKNDGFLKAGYSKTVSNSLISEWPTYNKTRLKGSAKLTTNNSTKENISHDNMCNSFSPCEMKLTKMSSEQEKCPRLFKKKKERISSDVSTSSSSEYSFTPAAVKNCKADSRFGYFLPYQPEKKFPNIYKNSLSQSANDNYQNNSMKWNSNDKFQSPVKKPLFPINAKNQVTDDHLSEFSFKLDPAKFENSRTKGNLFSNNRKVPKGDKENIFNVAKFTDTLLQHGERLVDDSGLSPNYVSRSRKFDSYLGDYPQSTNQIVLPDSSRTFENPRKKKSSQSRSSSSIKVPCNESFSFFKSPSNSNKHVQVILLPKGTCEQHGLSAFVELLEVVSLEDLKR